MDKAPDTIYLQWTDQENASTWSAGMIDENDVEYIRADKLKCCGNCKYQPYSGGIGELEPSCQFEDVCNNYSKWQPKESI